MNKFILAAAVTLLALPAFAGSPDFNRSLWVCSAQYSDGMATYLHCPDISDEAKLDDIETSLYDFEGGEGEAGDDGDDSESACRGGESC